MAVVCVTGAAGFLGSHLVKGLLEGGYKVHGTVRDVSDGARIKHLWDLVEGREGLLKLFSADNNVEGSYDEAVTGCEYVIHAASPVTLKARDPEKQLVGPAVAGVKNVFSSILKAKQAKRVVLVSSISAVGEYARGEPFTEADWYDAATIETHPYAVSKTRAERCAWEIYRQQPAGGYRFELVSIAPVYVLGPVLAPGHVRTSPSIIRQVLNGEMPLCPRLYFGIVDVRDLVAMHIEVLQNEKTSGRYIAHSEGLWGMDIVNILRPHYPWPKYRVPSYHAPTFLMYILSFFHPNLSLGYLREHLGVSYDIDTSKARQELGISFRPAAESILDTAKSLVEKDLLWNK